MTRCLGKDLDGGAGYNRRARASGRGFILQDHLIVARKARPHCDWHPVAICQRPKFYGERFLACHIYWPAYIQSRSRIARKVKRGIILHEQRRRRLHARHSNRATGKIDTYIRSTGQRSHAIRECYILGRCHVCERPIFYIVVSCGRGRFFIECTSKNSYKIDFCICHIPIVASSAISTYTHTLNIVSSRCIRLCAMSINAINIYMCPPSPSTARKQIRYIVDICIRREWRH